MQKAIEMLGQKKQEIQKEMKKIDEDILRREDGIKQERKRREELVDLLDAVDLALNKLQQK